VSKLLAWPVRNVNPGHESFPNFRTAKRQNQRIPTTLRTFCILFCNYSLRERRGLSIDLRIEPSPPTTLVKTVKREMIEMQLDDRVLTALERNPYVARRSLRFETNAGRVTLRGVVNTYFQKQMAQEAIRHVDGVHEIANELEVCWS
jgi:hypothetical protein